MKYFLIVYITVLPTAFSAEWKTGDFKLQLFQDQKGNWVTQNCLKVCSMEIVLKENLKKFPFESSELKGGKNPGSVLCKRILGKVIYLTNGQLTDAYCTYKEETISLSRINNLIF